MDAWRTLYDAYGRRVPAETPGALNATDLAKAVVSAVRARRTLKLNEILSRRTNVLTTYCALDAVGRLFFVRQLIDEARMARELLRRDALWLCDQAVELKRVFKENMDAIETEQLAATLYSSEALKPQAWLVLCEESIKVSQSPKLMSLRLLPNESEASQKACEQYIALLMEQISAKETPSHESLLGSCPLIRIEGGLFVCLWTLQGRVYLSDSFLQAHCHADAIDLARRLLS